MAMKSQTKDLLLGVIIWSLLVAATVSSTASLIYAIRIFNLLTAAASGDYV